MTLLFDFLKSQMKLLFKIFLGIFIAFIALALVLAALTQTDRFKVWLRDQLVMQAQEVLAGKLSLGRIEGNLVSNFKLVDLQLDYENETLAQIPRVEVGFRLFPLWNGRVQIDKFLIDSLALNLRQYTDSTWNIQKLTAIPSDTTSSSSWDMSFSNCEIRRGSVRFAPLDTASFLYQRACENISLQFQLEKERNRTIVALNNLSFAFSNFPLALQKVSGHLLYDTDSLRIEKLALEIGASKLSGEVSVTNLAQPQFRARLLAAPLQLEDMHAFVPQLTATGPLQIAAEISGDARSATGTLALVHAAGNVQADFAVRQDSLLAYELNAEIRGLDLAQLLPERAHSSRLNLDLAINGEGVALHELNATASVTMDSSRYSYLTISHLVAEGAIGNNQILGNLLFLSPNGELALLGSVRDFQQTQQFSFSLSAKGLDGAALLQDSAFVSNINFDLEGEGQGFDPQQLHFAGKLVASPSFFQQIKLDTLLGVFHFNAGDLRVDTLLAKTDVIDLEAAGRVSLTHENDLHFRADLGNLELARRAFEADTLEADGFISGRANGPADSLRLAGAFHLSKVKYNRTKIDTLFGDFTFARRDTNSGGVIHALAQKILAAVVPLDSMRATINYNLDHADLAADFWEGLENRGNLQGRYVYGDTGRFHVQEAAIDALDRHWETPPDSMWVDVGEDEYYCHNLKLRASRTQVFAQGRINLFGEQDFRFNVDEFDLASIAARLERKEELHGVLAGEVHFRGTFEQPKVEGHWLLRGGKFSEFAFEHLAGDFGYADEKISWDFTLAQDRARTLTGEGFLPVRMAGGDSGLVLREDRPFRVQAATGDLDLTFLQTFLPKLKRLKGSLVFDAKIENTLKDPQPRGVVRIYDGAFSVPDYGTSYRDFRLGLQIDPGVFNLVALKVLSEKGELNASAKVEYHKNKIQSAEGQLTAKEFPVARTRNVELLLDALVRARGDLQELRYTGEVTIKRSRFFLEGLQRQTALETTPPAEAAIADSTFVASGQVADPIANVLEKIHGALKIRIPRNTWIRGPEVNLEIEGELDFVQEGQEFSAFGPIRVKRGNYDMFGKRFEVQQGEIIFQGNLESSPTISLEARYVYRLDGDKQAMFVKITGALDNPQIEFLNEQGTRLEEKEALALLFFNVPFERLGITGGGDEPGDKMDLTKTARGLVSGLVSQQLSRTLGKSLKVDVIELESGEQLDLASVMVGKYLTNDIFVSVAQDFSGSARDLRVALELELARFLFLQAVKGGREDKETGFDVILKKEW